MKPAIGLVDKNQCAVGQEAADQIGLVFDHAAVTFLAFRGVAHGHFAFDGRAGQEKIADRHHADVTADEHQAGFVVARPKRPAVVQEFVNGQAATTNVPVVPPRWPKRNAAQTRNG